MRSAGPVVYFDRGLATTISSTVSAGRTAGACPPGRFPAWNRSAEFMESPAGVGAMVVNGAEPPLASDQGGGDPIDVGVGRCLLEQVRQPAYPAPRRAHHHGSSALSGSSETHAATDRPPVTPTLPAGRRSSVAATSTRPWHGGGTSQEAAWRRCLPDLNGELPQCTLTGLDSGAVPQTGQFGCSKGLPLLPPASEESPGLAGDRPSCHGNRIAKLTDWVGGGFSPHECAGEQGMEHYGVADVHPVFPVRREQQSSNLIPHLRTARLGIRETAASVFGTRARTAAGNCPPGRRSARALPSARSAAGKVFTS